MIFISNPIHVQIQPKMQKKKREEKEKRKTWLCRPKSLGPLIVPPCHLVLLSAAIGSVQFNHLHGNRVPIECINEDFAQWCLVLQFTTWKSKIIAQKATSP